MYYLQYPLIFTTPCTGVIIIAPLQMKKLRLRGLKA